MIFLLNVSILNCLGIRTVSLISSHQLSIVSSIICSSSTWYIYPSGCRRKLSCIHLSITLTTLPLILANKSFASLTSVNSSYVFPIWFIHPVNSLILLLNVSYETPYCKISFVSLQLALSFFKVKKVSISLSEKVFWIYI